MWLAVDPKQPDKPFATPTPSPYCPNFPWSECKHKLGPNRLKVIKWRGLTHKGTAVQMSTGLRVNSILRAERWTFPHQETLITRGENASVQLLTPPPLQQSTGGAWKIFLVWLYSFIFQRMHTFSPFPFSSQPHISFHYFHHLHTSCPALTAPKW